MLVLYFSSPEIAAAVIGNANNNEAYLCIYDINKQYNKMFQTDNQLLLQPIKMDVAAS